MSNKLAIFLGVMILAWLGWDYIQNDFDATFFLARKIIELIEWLAVWR